MNLGELFVISLQVLWHVWANQRSHDLAEALPLCRSHLKSIQHFGDKKVRACA